MNQTAFIMQKFELYDHEHYNNSNSYLVYVVETVSFSFFKLLLLLYIYIFYILSSELDIYKSRVKKDRIISEITAHSFWKQRNP